MAKVTQVMAWSGHFNLSQAGVTLTIFTLHCSSPRASRTPRSLPSWCVLVGWLLVAATSRVAAFFTMLYGLHYGRASSLKWFTSVALSFVESVFITQPLKLRTPVWLPFSPLPALCLRPAALF